MKLIIGLGNPGKKYEMTRHNVGWTFLDKTKEDLAFPNFVEEKKFKAAITTDFVGTEKVILAKPQTFMNNSG